MRRVHACLFRVKNHYIIVVWYYYYDMRCRVLILLSSILFPSDRGYTRRLCDVDRLFGLQQLRTHTQTHTYKNTAGSLPISPAFISRLQEIWSLLFLLMRCKVQRVFLCFRRLRCLEILTWQNDKQHHVLPNKQRKKGSPTSWHTMSVWELSKAKSRWSQGNLSNAKNSEGLENVLSTAGGSRWWWWRR